MLLQKVIDKFIAKIQLLDSKTVLKLDQVRRPFAWLLATPFAWLQTGLRACSSTHIGAGAGVSGNGDP